MAYDPYNQLQQPLPGETVYVYDEQDDQQAMTKPMALSLGNNTSPPTAVAASPFSLPGPSNSALWLFP